ncbi:MAG: hypothetical protein A2Y65_09785 [Deltaproteobacteria bacterium RBG_13_52_11]|nr:MAG: hypothetical protein A2Y65_09785 [Deltaproteobacteria bacterium RBG_13_52_11]
MSEMRLPSERHVKGFLLPETPKRVFSARGGMERAAPEEGPVVWHKGQHKYGRPRILESLHPLNKECGIFMGGGKDKPL